MEPFQLAQLPDNAFNVTVVMRRFNCDRETATHIVARSREQRVYKNDLYQVNVADIPAKKGWPAMLELSIKRIDKEPIHDWRELQEIKNLIIGPESEAVELYPAESRKVDSANQYWLYALKTLGLRFPFGMEQRLVGTPDEAAACGAKQRPFAEGQS